MKIVKFLLNDFTFENRDKREVDVISEVFESVFVLFPGDYNHSEKHSNLIIKKVKVPKIYKHYFYLKRIYLFFKKFLILKKHILFINPDVISSHDLLAFLISFFSYFFSFKKPIFIYDSHEFELGRNKKRSFLSKTIVFFLEKFVMKKASLTIVVNESIKNELIRIYKPTKPIIAIRNIPKYWRLNKSLKLNYRKKILNFFSSIKNPKILTYHGLITNGRGIEKTLEVLLLNSHYCYLIIGQGDIEYIKHIKEKIHKMHLNKRVYFLQYQKQNILKYYLAASDLGMIISPAVSKSYYFGLPNKLFENIQAENPVLVSNYPEFMKIIIEHKVGEFVDPNDTLNIYLKSEAMFENSKKKVYYINNIKKAKKVLNWKNEKIQLLEAYKEILLDLHK